MYTNDELKAILDKDPALRDTLQKATTELVQKAISTTAASLQPFATAWMGYLANLGVDHMPIASRSLKGLCKEDQLSWRFNENGDMRICVRWAKKQIVIARALP